MYCPINSFKMVYKDGFKGLNAFIFVAKNDIGFKNTERLDLTLKGDSRILKEEVLKI